MTDTLAILRARGYSSYTDYIRSEEWAVVRKRLNKPRRCVVCGSKKRLHHHHRSYARVGGDEISRDIAILCENCHAKTHDFLRKNGGSLYTAHLRWAKSRKTKKLPQVKGSPQAARMKAARRKKARAMSEGDRGLVRLPRNWPN